MGRTSAAGRRNGVRRARILAELTQAQLAEAVGVTRQTIVAVEAGDYAPSVYLALAIAGCLGTTVEALFASTTSQPTAPAAERTQARAREMERS
jgi:putative transcriptional regulator